MYYEFSVFLNCKQVLIGFNSHYESKSGENPNPWRIHQAAYGAFGRFMVSYCMFETVGTQQMLKKVALTQSEWQRLAQDNQTAAAVVSGQVTEIEGIIAQKRLNAEKLKNSIDKNKRDEGDRLEDEAAVLCNSQSALLNKQYLHDALAMLVHFQSHPNPHISQEPL